MMIALLTFALAAILSAIAVLHLYWAFGGQWMAREAIPTKADGAPLFSPGPAACIAVAIAALGAAALVGSMLLPSLREKYPMVYVYLPWLLCGVFAMRAIGDFRYCGFFKRIRGTLFSRSDTRIFTPLCLILSIVAGVVAIG
jgi:hypothetical protein